MILLRVVLSISNPSITSAIMAAVADEINATYEDLAELDREFDDVETEISECWSSHRPRSAGWVVAYERTGSHCIIKLQSQPASFH